MERITVNLGERSYPISIGAGLFANPALLSLSAKQKVVIVTNTLSLRCMRLRSFHYLITSVAACFAGTARWRTVQNSRNLQHCDELFA